MRITSKKSNTRQINSVDVSRGRGRVVSGIHNPNTPIDGTPTKPSSKKDRVLQAASNPQPEPEKQKMVLELTRVVDGKPQKVIKDKHVYKDNKMEEMYPNYKVRFAIVSAVDVLNLCSPEFNYRPKSWTDPVELEKRLIVGRKYLQAMNEKIGFYDRLEESVLREGFRNPIIITTGYPKFRNIEEVPPELRVLPSEMMVCELIGGSRLLIAQKHNLLIPAIINDFTGKFEDAPLLETPEQVEQYFTDVPNDILFTNRGLRITPPLHTHLEESAHSPRVVMDIRRQAIKVAYE